MLGGKSWESEAIKTTRRYITMWYHIPLKFSIVKHNQKGEKLALGKEKNNSKTTQANMNFCRILSEMRQVYPIAKV